VSSSPLNAATWQRDAAREITRAARKHTLAAVAMLDIDHFKKVNDPPCLHSV
jgi:PleD family two-component response regulator